jgi:hypothetical protein
VIDARQRYFDGFVAIGTLMCGLGSNRAAVATTTAWLDGADVGTPLVRGSRVESAIAGRSTVAD